jgi:hypothetical protein
LIVVKDHANDHDFALDAPHASCDDNAMTTTPIPSPLAPYSAARAALDALNSMITCDCPTPRIAPLLDCPHDIAQTIMRDLLSLDDDDSLSLDDRDYSFFADDAPRFLALIPTMTALFDAAFRTHYEYAPLAHETYNRDALSAMRLDFSLCPMHSCDYAICFDDDDSECAAIRACFPSHDT